MFFNTSNIKILVDMAIADAGATVYISPARYPCKEYQARKNPSVHQLSIRK